MINFEWDEAKAAINLRKHGVRFSLAVRVLTDPGRIEMYDGRENYGEDRWATIGHADPVPALLYVVYTVRNECTYRLISARKANEQERKQYRQANS